MTDEPYVSMQDKIEKIRQDVYDAGMMMNAGSSDNAIQNLRMAVLYVCDILTELTKPVNASASAGPTEEQLDKILLAEAANRGKMLVPIDRWNEIIGDLNTLRKENEQLSSIMAAVPLDAIRDAHYTAKTYYHEHNLPLRQDDIDLAAWLAEQEAQP